jgi:hypothetical protein
VNGKTLALSRQTERLTGETGKANIELRHIVFVDFRNIAGYF